MRNIATILLAGLLLFNCGGYRLYFYWMQVNTTQNLEARLDAAAYPEADLLQFAIPLNMPYQSTATDFHRADGELVINGVLYELVSQKIENNQLIIQAIPNFGKISLVKSEDNFFKLVSGLQQNKPEKKSSTNNLTITPETSPYDNDAAWSFHLHPFQSARIFCFPARRQMIANTAYNAPAQPPEGLTA